MVIYIWSFWPIHYLKFWQSLSSQEYRHTFDIQSTLTNLWIYFSSTALLLVHRGRLCSLWRVYIRCKLCQHDQYIYCSSCYDVSYTRPFSCIRGCGYAVPYMVAGIYYHAFCSCNGDFVWFGELSKIYG